MSEQVRTHDSLRERLRELYLGGHPEAHRFRYGLLAFDDTETAFRTFFGLVGRDVQIRLLLGDRLETTEAEIARDAARADAAATLIANAVDVPSAAIRRVPACSLDPDSDLGERLVTADVGSLTATEITAALDAGLARAESFLASGHIIGAALRLCGEVRVAGRPRLPAP